MFAKIENVDIVKALQKRPMLDAQIVTKGWNFVGKGRDRYLYVSVDIEKNSPHLIKERKMRRVAFQKEKYQVI